MPAPQEKYRWNATAARYVEQRTGRFVGTRDVRVAIDKALDAEATRIATITNRMRAGRMTLGAWQDAMRESIKNVHLYSAAAAKGGWAQLTRADYGHVGRILRDQYTYLNRFAGRLESGEISLDGRAALSRAQMYAQAGRHTYHIIERADKEDAGYDEEKNDLTAGESCSGCNAESALGWVAIGTLTPVGSRNCLANCRCHIMYRRVAENGEPE